MGYTFDQFSEELKIDEAIVDTDPIINIIYDNMEVILSILQRENTEEVIKTSFGATIKPLGSGKLKIIDLVARVIRIKSLKVHNRIKELKIIETITVRLIDNSKLIDLGYVF
jgi:SIT4 phosphatase-associated protein.